MGKYIIRYFHTNFWGETAEVCYETFHPTNQAELVKFALIKCGIYGLTYTTEKLSNI